MPKFEKKLLLAAIFFVVIYLGAIGITIQSRISARDSVTLLESAQAGPGERHLMLAELFLPMMILLTVSVCVLIVRKKRAKDILILDENEKKLNRQPPTNSPAIKSNGTKRRAL